MTYPTPFPQRIKANKQKATEMKGILLNIKRVIGNYFRETTVHGFRYVVEGTDIFERCFWVIVIVASFFVSALVILTSFYNWDDVPLQTTIETASLPVETLDFPATTVCNLEAMQMPRRNRRLFIEQGLNMMEPRDTKTQKENTGKTRNINFNIYFG